ncbi:hypothetical protein BVRB_9g209710 [Beta vulgaris subsp. vulgaris]|nr:hypothetical protein BVRB_9g209710 [Beta vulgaris subsp. vulgaris]
MNLNMWERTWAVVTYPSKSPSQIFERALTFQSVHNPSTSITFIWKSMDGYG